MNSKTDQPIRNPKPAASGRRVALVFASFRGGGIQRSMLRAAEELLARGFEVDLVVGRRSGDLIDVLPKNARVIELERASRWQMCIHVMKARPERLSMLLHHVLLAIIFSGKVGRLASLVRYFDTEQPAAAFAASPPFNLIAVWARRLTRLQARIVISQRNTLWTEKTGDRRWSHGCPPKLLRDVYEQADAIVAVSDGVADELALQTGIERSRITTVFNPVIGPHFAARAREPIDHPWFTPGQPPVILGSGTLHPQKDFPNLIRAFARVRAVRPARLMILGGLPNKDKLADYVQTVRALPAQLGIADDVEFPGWVDNPSAYMARAHLFVMSSAWEGLGNVLIEALACGCPVVSTDCPHGPSEILDNGRFGPLVPVGDDAALAAAMLKVLDAPPSRDRQRARATPFTAEHAIDRYLELLFGDEHAGDNTLPKPSR